MQNKYFILLLLLFTIDGYSQGEFNNWYFGWHAGMTFNSGPPVALPASPIAQSSGISGFSISDSIGNFLFCSEGKKIYDKFLNVTPNGAGLLGGGADCQAAIALQLPGNTRIYYIITAGHDPGAVGPVIGLHYSVFNMDLNGGLGDIVPGMKNIALPFGDSVVDQLTATRHANNRDYWIVVLNHATTNNYLAYRLTSSGIEPTPVISPTSFKTKLRFRTDFGYLKISFDGRHLVCTDSIHEVCTFNTTAGTITPKFTFSPDFPNLNHVLTNKEFSVDSRFLYLTGGAYTPFDTPFFQYDMNAPDSLSFMQSQYLVGYGTGGNIQSGPDGKIYLGNYTPFGDSVHVIKFPSLPGSSCSYEKNILSLGNDHNFCFPQFVQRYKAYIHHIGTCQDDPIQFSADIWPPADSLHWNFGDPASGAANTSNSANPEHIFMTAGTYIVELFVRHNDNRTDTSWQTIHILPSPQPILGSDRTICNGNSTTFDAGFCSGCSFEWKNLGTGFIVGTNQTFTTGVIGNYSVKVTNGNNCSGYDTVQLVTTPVPQVTNTQLTKSICSGESTDIALSPSVPGTMFHWTASLVSGNIIGFSADSGLVINQILVDILPTAGVVTYSVTPKVGSCSGNAVDFTVTVNPGDSAKVSVTASANNICSGTLVTFTAVPTNPGTSPVYQWKVNGVGTGSNSPVFAYAPANGDQVQCVLTSSMTVCISNNPASSNIVFMTVNPLLPVSVAVSASANIVCAGTTVVFTAAPVNGGSTPSYQWKVNGIPAGSNSSVYSYVPANGDAVSCTLSSSETCATGNPATSPAAIMTVNPLLPASVSIAASSNPFCIGASVVFSAAAVNGGPLAAYQWKVNGTNAGANSSTYTYNPVAGDVISCILTSSLQCVSGSPASSNSIVMTGTLGLPASVAIAANPNPFCPGSPVAFTAAPGNGGAAPAFQWKVNGANAGSNAPTFVYNPSDHDSVRCVMTSNLACVSSNPALSNKIVLSGSLAPPVSFSACFDTLTTVNAKPFKLKGGLPLGGAWSGPGVNALTGTFDPAAAGTGLKTIAYSYTNVYLCSATKTKTIAVQPASPFTCGNTLTDIRDGKTYPTVQIGSQCWMAANLNRGTQVVSSLVQMDNCTDEKYCFGNDPAKCSRYGGLYQWDEMMRYDDTPAGQGICPPSWHIPTDNDWTTLCNFYNGFGFAGKPLQDSVISGFRALTGGVFYLNSSWSFTDFAVLFWTSTPWGSSKALSHGLNIYNFSVSLYPASRANAFPIRCLKD
jgi:uncharacterized protein (TIGR02145 family)